MQQGSAIGRGMIITAATVIVLAGMSLAREVVGPVLMGLFFALIFSPVRSWLQQRGVSGGLSLALIALMLVAIVGFLGFLVALSAGQLLANLDQYQELLRERLSGVTELIAGLGLTLEAPASPGASSAWLIDLVGAIVGAVAGFGWGFFQLLLIMLFIMVDGAAIMQRLHGALGEHPFLLRVGAIGPRMVRFFGLRTYLNALTGVGVAVAFLLFGVDFAVLWGVLMFFMSYVPYIGIFVASVPPVILALAEFGLGRALLVIGLITVVNVLLENVIMPRMVGKGLSMPAVLVFLSFFFWNFLLGAAGALLSPFLTSLALMLVDSFPESRWIARAFGASSEAGVAEGANSAGLPGALATAQKE